MGQRVGTQEQASGLASREMSRVTGRLRVGAAAVCLPHAQDFPPQSAKRLGAMRFSGRRRDFSLANPAERQQSGPHRASNGKLSGLLPRLRKYNVLYRPPELGLGYAYLD